MPGSPPSRSVVHLALCHAAGWFVTGNTVGLWLALLLLFPEANVGEWTYGRWVPVHLDIQLFGWTSLPLVAWLFAVYEVDRSRAGRWGSAAVWAWTVALGAGVLGCLGGQTSGKIFLDWRAGPLWGLVAAMIVLWLVLAAACRDRASGWSPWRRRLAWGGIGMLALVPWSMVFAASPKVYPPVDATTGGPTGASLLGSTLVVVSLMLLLPRAGAARGSGRAGWGVWTYLANCWMVFLAAEWIGGTHHQAHQIGAMALLLPWAFLIPWDWAAFEWPDGSGLWRRALLLWWGLLAFSGVAMYLPGFLDRIKFTQGLVAHSHVAMAGFTTSFCALIVVTVGGRSFGGHRSVMAWHGAALVMVGVLALMGIAEGGGYAWMLENPWWRLLGLSLRAFCGTVMLVVSVSWWLSYQIPNR